MPFTFDIDVEHRLVTSIATGVVTVNDVEDHQKGMATDSRFDPDFDQLADLTAVTKIAIASDQVKRLASRKPFSSKSRRAVVVTSKEIFGMLRMFATYHELSGSNEEVEFFENREDAMKWLSRT